VSDTARALSARERATRDARDTRARGRRENMLRARPGRDVATTRTRATVEPRGNDRKKAPATTRKARRRKGRAKTQEFAEDEGRRTREFDAAMREVGARVGGDETTTVTTAVGASFDEKLEAMRAAAKEKKLASGAQARASGTFDMDAKVRFGDGGAAKPAGPMANYMDEERAATASEDEEGNQTLVRVVSFLAACALLVVFIPSDLTFQAAIPQGKGGLSESVKEEVQKQADAVVEALSSSPEDADKLRQAAQSFLALDDYPKALPYLERLVAVDPTNEENVSALAETWIADGQPRRAVEAFRGIIDADVLGKGQGQTAPSPSFLRGFLDALGKDGRNGLALDYAKTFSKKGWVDEVDGRLLEARVYSAWKGHGKDAESAYDAVITQHPEDFRGYLAQGVFFRTVGKPDAAEDAFRKAKSLAPGDTASVVNQVIAASKASKR
jgi:tetratricopeptide (TPR) repeat protein